MPHSNPIQSILSLAQGDDKLSIYAVRCKMNNIIGNSRPSFLYLWQAHAVRFSRKYSIPKSSVQQFQIQFWFLRSSVTHSDVNCEDRYLLLPTCTQPHLQSNEMRWDDMIWDEWDSFVTFLSYIWYQAANNLHCTGVQPLYAFTLTRSVTVQGCCCPHNSQGLLLNCHGALRFREEGFLGVSESGWIVIRKPCTALYLSCRWFRPWLVSEMRLEAQLSGQVWLTPWIQVPHGLSKSAYIQRFQQNSVCSAIQIMGDIGR